MNKYVVTVELGDDYYVEYSNNTLAGNAKVKVTGIKNYKDSITENFVISDVQAKLDAARAETSRLYARWEELENKKLLLDQ